MKTFIENFQLLFQGGDKVFHALFFLTYPMMFMLVIFATIGGMKDVSDWDSDI